MQLITIRYDTSTFMIAICY